jgi:hypothetical protein
MRNNAMHKPYASIAQDFTVLGCFAFPARLAPDAVR